MNHLQANLRVGFFFAVRTPYDDAIPIKCSKSMTAEETTGATKPQIGLIDKIRSKTSFKIPSAVLAFLFGIGPLSHVQLKLGAKLIDWPTRVVKQP